MKKKTVRKKPPVSKKTKWHYHTSWHISVISVGVMFAFALLSLFFQKNTAPVSAYGDLPIYIKVIGAGNAATSQYLNDVHVTVIALKNNTRVNGYEFSYPIGSLGKAAWVGEVSPYSSGGQADQMRIYINPSPKTSGMRLSAKGDYTFSVNNPKCTQQNPCTFTIIGNCTITVSKNVCNTSNRQLCTTKTVNSCSGTTYSNCTTKLGSCGVPANKNCTTGECVGSGTCRAEGGKFTGTCVNNGTAGVCCKF